MSTIEKHKWCHEDDFDSDSNISTKLQKAEDDDKVSAALSQIPVLDKFNTTFSQKRSNPERERHAELFRKDLISAMKLADSELLQPEEYFQISDAWKLEWERGVQVPINPGAILPNVVRSIAENENLYGPQTFKLPKKYLHASQDDAFKPAVHELHEVQKLTEQVCRYDLDDLDITWLQKFNDLRDDYGDDPVSELEMEKAIEELETRCHSKLQEAIKTVEGLGIEYDENVVCDVCRSPEGEDSNEMVFCDSCDICVHQACYGIQTIPEGNWLCRACALGIKPQCVLCPNSGGAMKSTKNGSEWAHISCALWIPEVHIGCPEKMEPINNINQIPASRWALVCTLCRERQGACIQCCVKSCKTSFHVTCAFQNNLEMHQTYDETIEDVQMKAFCPKHSGQKNDDSVNEDGTVVPIVPSPKPQTKSELTEEEKTELRSHRLKKLEEEFYNYVTPSEVAVALGMEEEAVVYIYNYWVIKRKAQFNQALLMPKMEEGDFLLKQREDGLVARLKMFIHLRQELERVRNLCYMVNRREKLSRQMYRMKEDIFFLLTNAVVEDDCQDDLTILNSYRMTNTIYDHPEGILRAAKLMEQNEQTSDAQESQTVCSEAKVNGLFGENFGTKTEHDSEALSQTEFCSSVMHVIDGAKEEFLSTDKFQELVNEKLLDQAADLLVSSKEKLVVGKENGVGNSDDFKKVKWNKSDYVELNDTKNSYVEELHGRTAESSTLFTSDSLLKENAEDIEMGSDKVTMQNSCLSLAEDSGEAQERSIHDHLNGYAWNANQPDTGWERRVADQSHKAIILAKAATDQNSESILGNEDNMVKQTSLLSMNLMGLENEVYKSPRHAFHSKSPGNSSSHHHREQNSEYEETDVPSQTTTEKSETIRLKRRRTAICMRQNKRLKHADKIIEETKDSTAVLSPDSSVNGHVIPDNDSDDMNHTKYERQGSLEVPTTKPLICSIPVSGHLSGSASDKQDELNGWSKLKHKLPSNNMHGIKDILKRFSPEQLVVSKEIRQRVESCLLNLPSLKSFNGLCTHLQKKLAACNLHYNKQTLEAPKQRADGDKRDLHNQSSTVDKLPSAGIKKKTLVHDWQKSLTYSKAKHRTKLTCLRAKQSEQWETGYNDLSILKGSSIKQPGMPRNCTSFKEHKYEHDDSDSLETVNDIDSFPSELSSGECSRSSSGDSYSFEHIRDSNADRYPDSIKHIWLSKFKQ